MRFPFFDSVKAAFGLLGAGGVLLFFGVAILVTGAESWVSWVFPLFTGALLFAWGVFVFKEVKVVPYG